MHFNIILTFAHWFSKKSLVFGSSFVGIRISHLLYLCYIPHLILFDLITLIKFDGEELYNR
jgi:hypothetical protein